MPISNDSLNNGCSYIERIGIQKDNNGTCHRHDSGAKPGVDYRPENMYSNAMHDETDKLQQIIADKDYQHVIFDLDETLLELTLPWEEWISAISPLLPEHKNAAFVDAIYNPGTTTWGEVINSYIAQDNEFYRHYLAISQEFENRHFAYNANTSLIALVPLLHQKGKDMYLWTNNVKSTAIRSLHELEVLPYFRAIVSREDTLLGKPDPEGWNAIYSTGQDTASYVFVGDSRSDEITADAIGIDFYKINHFKTKHSS